MTATWEATLLDLEQRVLTAEAALDAGEDFSNEAIAPFTPPVDLGPLPESLRERALEVLARQGELEARLANVLGTVSRELAQTTRAGSATKPSPFAETTIPKYFDSAI